MTLALTMARPPHWENREVTVTVTWTRSAGRVARERRREAALRAKLARLHDHCESVMWDRTEWVSYDNGEGGCPGWVERAAQLKELRRDINRIEWELSQLQL